LTISIRLDGRKPKAVSLLPERTALKHSLAEDAVEIEMPVLKDFAMIEVSWQ
jgi:hypothetical protein